MDRKSAAFVQFTESDRTKLTITVTFCFIIVDHCHNTILTRGRRESGSQHITARLITLHHTGNALSPPLPIGPLIRDDTYPVAGLWLNHGQLGNRS